MKMLNVLDVTNIWQYQSIVSCRLFMLLQFSLATVLAWLLSNVNQIVERKFRDTCRFYPCLRFACRRWYSARCILQLLEGRLSFPVTVFPWLGVETTWWVSTNYTLMTVRTWGDAVFSSHCIGVAWFQMEWIRSWRHCSIIAGFYCIRCVSRRFSTNNTAS